MVTQLPKKPLSIHPVVKIKYFDLPSALLTFLKAFTMVPLWAVLFIPMIGVLLSRTGWMEEPLSWLLVFAAAAYYYHDGRSLKLTIEHGVLHRGLRSISLHMARAIRLKYDRAGILPTDLIIESPKGETLELKLSRLGNQGLGTLLDAARDLNPDCSIAPDIQTLQDCRSRAAKTNIVVDPALIAYHGHRHLVDMYHIFADQLSDLVPVGLNLFSIALLPVAFCTCSNLLLMYAHPGGTEGYSSYFGSHAILMGLSGFTSLLLLSAPMAVGAATWFLLVNNPYVVATLSIIAVLTMKHLLQAVFKPNVIASTDQCIEMQLRFEDDSHTMASVPWSELCALHLESADGDIGSDSCRITLLGNDGKPAMSLNMYAIDRPDRERLIAMVKKHAPHCAIDPAVLEAVAMKRSRSYTELWLQSLSRVNTRSNVEPLAPGQLVSQERYEVMRRLASGGLGTAYLAQDLSITPDLTDSRELNDSHERSDAAHNPSVVLKEMFLPAFANTRAVEQAVERFEHEVRILERINHPGIVKLIDSFVEDHRGCLVLEHIEGLTLKKMVDVHGPVSTEQANDLILQMCDILSHLHDRQIIHRDFTPDNLILDSRGRLHLLDFNVAQQVDSGKAGTVVGKHSYLPPEQFRGKATIASDIYAMGATTYYILTGLDPEPITQSRPTDKAPHVDSTLDDFCAAATALSLDKRYKNAAEARDALLGLQRLELTTSTTKLIEQQA